jgi:hypothetical protein
MGAGKTTLREEFDARIASDDPETPYENDSIEIAFQHYKEATERILAPDWEFFKEMLPEFAENGNEFAIIRAEASGLAQATLDWAKELKAHSVLEVLGDRPSDEFIADKTTDREFIVIGVTTDPAINAAQLHERNTKTGQDIDDATLARTIKGFSEEGYQALSRSAKFAILVQSDPYKGFEVIHAMKKGHTVDVKSEEHAAFLNLGPRSENEILQQMNAKLPQADRPAYTG